MRSAVAPKPSKKDNCKFNYTFRLINKNWQINVKFFREYHSNFKKEIIRGGNKIHSLIANTLQAVDISEASPGWQEYLNYLNEIILNGFKISTYSSLKNMLACMTDPEVTNLQKYFLNYQKITKNNLKFLSRSWKHRLFASTLSSLTLIYYSVRH